FSAKAQHNPLAGRKSHPDNLFSAAVEVQLEFEDVAESGATLLNRVMSVFSRKQTSDDARFNDVHEAVNAVAEHVQQQGEAIETRFSALTAQIDLLKQNIEQHQQGVIALKTKLSNSENLNHSTRPIATGSNATAEVLTDC
ncbi:TPA: GPO family capsid scaffolding protein, partial [Yersinia enterocolitica]